MTRTPVEIAADKFAVELRKWWSFDDGQIHTHSWHSREDFIKHRLPALLEAERKAALEREGFVVVRNSDIQRLIIAKSNALAEIEVLKRGVRTHPRVVAAMLAARPQEGGGA